MFNILPIAHLGHTVLRKQTLKVDDIHDKQFLKLIEDMIATVENAKGLGIAAPQVYTSKSVFVIASKPSTRYPNAPAIKPFAVINPNITNYSERIEKDWEGCLSIPGIRGYVPRSKIITVEYISQTGEKIVQTLEGFIARIFQHEYDHLNGIVFLDRLDSTMEIISERAYQNIITNKTV